MTTLSNAQTVADANSELYGLAWAGVAVPEPTTAALLILAMSLLCTSQTRRRRR